jgi:hypothetical protein
VMHLITYLGSLSLAYLAYSLHHLLLHCM